VSKRHQKKPRRGVDVDVDEIEEDDSDQVLTRLQV
jgi:hypothetical protein